MAKTFEKAVTGFNHNIKHKGKVYHVQTEDSGVNNPHIITHLFVGGNILASKKTSYADILGAENLPELVRELMEEQHKEMLRNLIHGVYDGIEAAHGRHYQPGQLATDVAPAPAPDPTPPPTPARAPAPVTGGAPALAAVHKPAAVPPPRPPLPPEVVAARELKVQPKLNEQPHDTLFGEDLISEKSLDEVILSYLAGETE